MPAFALPYSVTRAYALGFISKERSPTACITDIIQARGFGTELSPVESSAHSLSTSELLRTL
jgi:hypothetical protein